MLLFPDLNLFQFDLKVLHLLAGASAMGSTGLSSFLVLFEDVTSSTLDSAAVSTGLVILFWVVCCS